MKNSTIIHILLFLLLMLVYQCTHAQDYVLTTRGDSLTGEVKPLFYGNAPKVQLTTPGDEKTTLSLFEVRAFSHDGEIYHPVKGETGYVFMKLLQPGYLSLYAYQPENQTRFDGLFLKKLDGEKMVVPNIGFRKYISQFIEDCPDVVERVKEGELGKKNLDELITAYNACIEGRTVDHVKEISIRREQTTIINAWDALEEKIQEKDFSEKNNALEMIAEIRKKVRQQENIPNFLVEGLKESLKDTGLSDELNQALKEINR
jgi:hypothetical protein